MVCLAGVKIQKYLSCIKEKMIYEFYNILPNKDNIEQIGVAKSFSIGMSKYMTQIVNMFDDSNMRLSPIIKTDLRRLKKDDCFLVGIRAKDDLFIVGVHIKGTDEDDIYKDKLIKLYNEFQVEIDV